MRLIKIRVYLIIYEPSHEAASTFYGSEVVGSLEDFKARSQIIIANRMSSEISDGKGNVYTRDLFGRHRVSIFSLQILSLLLFEGKIMVNNR